VSRSRWLWVGAAAIAIALAGLAAVLLTRDDATTDDSVARRLRAQAALDRRVVMFGDTVRARVDVTFDRRRVDDDSVKVRAAFKEWRRVGQPEVVRHRAGEAVHLRVTYVLRCLRSDCPPERESRPFEFDPAVVEFVDLDSGTPSPSSLEVFWPRLIVNTRISPGDLTAQPGPWRGDLAAVPEPSYRAEPSLLAGFALGGAGLLVLLGGALVYAGWPRREPEPVPDPIVVPEFSLTPLEQALELLEDAARANGAADQRRSLELVAEVLGERGDEDGLAPAARELAWSPTPPPPEATKGLAARVRATLDEELRKIEAERRRQEAAAAAAVAADAEARARRH
jgi:hypothetical protein